MPWSGAVSVISGFPTYEARPLLSSATADVPSEGVSVEIDGTEGRCLEGVAETADRLPYSNAQAILSGFLALAGKPSEVRHPHRGQVELFWFSRRVTVWMSMGRHFGPLRPSYQATLRLYVRGQGLRRLIRGEGERSRSRLPRAVEGIRLGMTPAQVLAAHPAVGGIRTSDSAGTTSFDVDVRGGDCTLLFCRTGLGMSLCSIRPTAAAPFIRTLGPPSSAMLSVPPSLGPPASWYDADTTISVKIGSPWDLIMMTGFGPNGSDCASPPKHFLYNSRVTALPAF